MKLLLDLTIVGHHTIESCFTSQFEQHLRAVVGLPLGDPSMKTPAAIVYNILGEDEGEPGFHLAHQLIGRALVISGATVHLYDKPAMQKQRKMGHITIVGPSMGIVEARLKSMLNEDILDGQAAGENSVSTPDPEMMFSYALSARGRGIQIIIAGAGGAALLPGMVAALTPLACYWCSCMLLITGWT